MRESEIKEIDEIKAISDPAQRARRLGALTASYQAAVTELVRLRREAVEELRQQGLSQHEVAQLVGLSRARVGQIEATGPPPERGFLGTDRLTVAVALKRESEQGRPAVAQETVHATTLLRELASEVELDVEIEYVQPPGHVDLNRANLIVMVGPRLSPLVSQILAGDPALRFVSASGGWRIHDQAARVDYVSPCDSSHASDYGYLGRLPRPDGHGTFLYLAGIHAIGTQGVAHYLRHNLAETYREVRDRRFSTLISADADPDSLVVESSKRVTPFYRHG